MLTQVEADTLLAAPKRFVSHPGLLSLEPGTAKSYDLEAAGREEFVLDLSRGVIRLGKVKMQTRARAVYPLARLDLDGAPHTNPDGERIGGTHLHLYREGYDDRWAQPPDPAAFPRLGDLAGALLDFLQFCRIEAVPVQASLP